MPRYDYRCTACGRELELTHRMSETPTHHAHLELDGDRHCDGSLERLVALVGLSHQGSGKLSDHKLEGLGFTKYVRGSKGYEKAFGGSDTPGFVKREP